MLQSSMELLDHALSHLEKGESRDLRIAVTGADNAIELLLKEVARYKGIRIIDKNGHSISYYQAINSLQKAGTRMPELPDIDILHAERNNIYHSGSQPSRQTADWLVTGVALPFVRRFCQFELRYDITDFSDDFQTIMRMSSDPEKARAKIVAKSLARAQSNYAAMDYSQALVAAYAGIEGYLRSAIPLDLRSRPRALESLIRDGLLSDEEVKKIIQLRTKRNVAVHGVSMATRLDAKEAIELLEIVVDRIDPVLQ